MKKLLLTLLSVFTLSAWQVNAQLTEGFETWPPTGWTLTSSNTSNDITQSSSWANSGTYSLRFASYTSASTYDQYAVTPVLETNAGTHIVSFWHKASSSWGTEEFSVGYSTTGANLSTDFTWTATQTSSTTASQFTLANLPAGTTYVAIHYYSDYAYYMYVDDFSFAAPATCPAPSVLAASGQTATTVDLAWTDGDSETLWDIELVDVTASGSATGTPTTEDVTTNPYTLSGLTPENEYQVYLRADCSGDNSDASDWVGPVSFSTPCEALTTPIAENFETFTTSTSAFTDENCWSAVGGLYFWEMASGTDTSSGSTGPSPTVTSGNYFFTEASSGATGDTASLSVQVDLSGLTTPYLSFDYHMYGANIGSLEVLINTNIVLTLTGQQQSSDTSPFLNTGVALSAYTGQSVTVTLRGTRGGGYAGDIAIDNFVINEAPTCPDPSSLAASGQTATTVDLAWTDGDSETLWDIELVDVTASGSATGTPTTEDVATNPYTLSGLTPENEYQVYLRADCGGGDTSDWVGPVSFTTWCEGYTIPYFEGFETGYTHQSAVGGCITQEDISGTNFWKANDTYTGLSQTPRTGSWNATIYYSGGPNTDWMYIPVSLTAGQSYDFEAFARHHYSDNDGNITVSFGNTPSAAAMTTTIVAETSTNGGTTGGDYLQIAGSFTPSTTATYYIGIKGYLENSYNALSIDDISIEETPACAPPIGLSIAAATADTASASWTAAPGATTYQYELVDVTAGSSATGIPTGSSATETLTIDSLDEGNQYGLLIRAVCGLSQSAWSTQVNWTNILAPDCPTNFSAPDGSTIAPVITLTWDAPTTGSTVVDYEVSRSTDGISFISYNTTTSTSMEIAFNTNATAYYKVIARNGGGDSASCSIQQVTTNQDGTTCSTPILANEGTNTQYYAKHYGQYSSQYSSFTTTVAGDLTVSSCASFVDTYLILYNSNCEELTYDDDNCGSQETLTITNVLPNQEYIIEWWSIWSGNDFDYEITQTTPCSGPRTTWDGTAWSNGAPDANSYAIMSGAYSTGTNGAITACYMQAEASVTIDGATDATIGEVLLMTGNTLTIDETSSLTVSGDFTNSGGTVTLNSTADDFSSLIVTGTATGDITYNRYVNVYDDTLGGGWDLVCSPVDMTIADFITANGANIEVLGDDYAFSQYDNALGQWVRYATTTSTTCTTGGTETFTDIGSGDGYDDRSWTGDDGSTWTATNAIDGQTITGAAITLNDDTANTYVQSGTISGGICNITISTKRPFGDGSGTLDVLINGSSVGTVPYSGSVQTTTISDINITGDIVIRIDNNIGGSNGGGFERVTIDDITWTAATQQDLGSFTTSQGYSMATTAGATVAFTGTMETTSQSINIINNNGLNGVGRRWNLVSNPFPSYINGNDAAGTANFMDVNAAVIDSEFLAVYGWNGSEYTIYNQLSGAFSMAPGQGFWVAALGTTDTALDFTAAMRTTTGTGDFVQGPQPLTHNVGLKLYNGDIERAATEFYFRDGLSLDLDPGYDAAAFNQSTKLSSRLTLGSQETAFGINAMSIDALQNTRVPLEVRQNAGQAFTISMADMNLPEDIYVYLEDTVNGTLTSLKENDFELVAQSNLSGADRFFIVFKSNSVLSSGDTLGINALNVFKANNDDFVTIAGITPDLEQLDVRLYSMLGQTVRQDKLNTTTATQRISTAGLASGLYMVQIKSGNQTTVKKVIIK